MYNVMWSFLPGRMGVYTAMFVYREHMVIQRDKLRVLCANQVSGDVHSTITAWAVWRVIFLELKSILGTVHCYASRYYSLSHIVQIMDFLDFLHEYCKEKIWNFHRILN